jgi:hypothetical protein
MIAVTQGPDGLTTYTYNPNTSTLTLNATFNETFFNGKVDISDIALHEDEVYILDRLSGVSHIALPTHPHPTHLQPILLDPIFLHSDCSNLAISDLNKAYLTCPEIHEIDLMRRTVREFSDEMFHARDLVVGDGMVIATRDNLIRIYVEGNVVGFYWAMRMDKLRMQENRRMFIVSETNLMYVNWYVEKPSITCGLKSKGNEHIEG